MILKKLCKKSIKRKRSKKLKENMEKSKKKKNNFINLECPA